MNPPPSPYKNIAIFSNYVPIECGISTFAKNLFDAIKRHSPAGETFVIGVDDGHPIGNFPEEVAFEVSKNSRSDYRLAADYINSRNVDMVCIQHEYGIYGGQDGVLILDAIRRIEKPIIVTLHTVLENPSASQKSIVTAMAHHAAKMVVMSERAVEMLQRVYKVPAEKIEMIHHGVPDEFGITKLLREAPNQGATLMTFGLLSPDKGIENVIRAMPRIVAERPDAKYVVVGATHPHIRRNHGEAYRESLVQLAEELGIASHVEFVNRFVSPCEIVEFLETADIYVTPYLKKEQITSGTLAYAIGCGKVVISTPYWYAEELLRDDRGIIVPPQDSDAIADAAIDVLTNTDRRQSYENRASTFGKSMSWRSVGGEYVSLVEGLPQESAVRGATLPLATTKRIPELDLSHLRRMTDSTGLLQHAIYTMPRFSEGYCLDDNCRALYLTSMIRTSSNLPPHDLDELASHYLAFMAYAFNAETGQFRNFLSYSGAWLEEAGSEDSQGRALWCLGGFLANSKNASQVLCARELFRAAFPASNAWTSPRAWSYAILGLAALDAAEGSCPKRALACQKLTDRLTSILKSETKDGWRWFEPYVTYCNARIPQALIAAGVMTQNNTLVEIGVDSLEWLWQNQLNSNGHFEPIGCNTPYFSQSEKATFDQQPVEVCATIGACVEAWRATKEEVWRERAWTAFDWFLGANHLCKPVFDATTGGCFDGGQEGGLNLNQGAESTVSFLMACEDMRIVNRSTGRIRVRSEPNATSKTTTKTI